jgi:DNA-binding MarR family transcriptional regulator
MSGNQLYTALNETALLLHTSERAFSQRFGLTPTLLHLLHQLHLSEGQQPTQLSALLLLDTSTLTRAIDRLTQAGLAQRRADPHDRRAVRLTLTPAGQVLRDATLACHEQLIARQLGVFSVTEQQQLAALLVTLRAGLVAALDHEPALPTSCRRR